MPGGISVEGSLGYVGFVKILSDGKPAQTVKATSCDLRVNQEITPESPIIGRTDRAVYWVGARLVDGGCAFNASSNDYSSTILYRHALSRDTTGSLRPLTVDVRYTNGVTARYTNCIVNEFNFSVSQGELLNVDVTFLGEDRVDSPADVSPTIGQDYVINGNIVTMLTAGPAPLGTAAGDPNERLLTWADTTLSITFPDGTVEDITGIRSFNASINNNAERVWTWGSLQPRFIIPKIREINGSFEYLGRAENVFARAEGNQDRCVEASVMTFGFEGQTCPGGFTGNLQGIVFELEQIEITNDIFVTNVNWFCFPGDQGKILDRDAEDKYQLIPNV